MDVADVARRGVVAGAAPAPLAERVLGLQRTAGNRAVARMLASGSARELVLARDKVNERVTEVTKPDSKKKVDWSAYYDVEFDEDRQTCWATVKIRLNPDGDISDEDISWTKVGVLSRFALLWDERFSFHEHRKILSDRDWVFRPQIQFVGRGVAHELVNLHSGVGQSQRTEWFLMKPGPVEIDGKSFTISSNYAEIEHAHEVSHQLGLLDEYISGDVPGREVYSDHSLMGDYPNEGVEQVSLKPRHGQRIADLIGRAADKDLTSTMVRNN